MTISSTSYSLLSSSDAVVLWISRHRWFVTTSCVKPALAAKIRSPKGWIAPSSAAVFLLSFFPLLENSPNSRVHNHRKLQFDQRLKFIFYLMVGNYSTATTTVGQYQLLLVDSTGHAWGAHFHYGPKIGGYTERNQHFYSTRLKHSRGAQLLLLLLLPRFNYGLAENYLTWQLLILFFFSFTPFTLCTFLWWFYGSVVVCYMSFSSEQHLITQLPFEMLKTATALHSNSWT